MASDQLNDEQNQKIYIERANDEHDGREMERNGEQLSGWMWDEQTACTKGVWMTFIVF